MEVNVLVFVRTDMGNLVTLGEDSPVVVVSNLFLKRIP